ncbi:VOC family protein [Sphingomonas sp. DT-204]|uniref:VOC family protein n=1 Tax=Sphingomonas sp. DT-204 TaxID=3396166 RepID=UPI003F1B888C
MNPVPEGYRSVIPYLIVDDAAAAIDFYVRVFGGEEVMRYAMGDKIGHAEIKIGDSHIMLADESPEMSYRGPKAIGGTPVSVMLYLREVDQVFARAIAAGATEERAVQDQFYGDRSGTLVDPFGHRWTVATHIEDVSPEEMERRMKSMSEPEAAEA